MNDVSFGARNRTGQAWDWRIKHDGSLSAKGSKKILVSTKRALNSATIS